MTKRTVRMQFSSPAASSTNLADPNTWCQALGLLPVPLYGGDSREPAYVMLNGMRGNFYLDLRTRAYDVDVMRSEAWSANVGHRVTLRGSEIVVQRWDRPAEVSESFPAAYVADRLERFHTYLEHQAPISSLSIVAHGVEVFRTLWNTLGRETGGRTALNVFLVLVATTADDCAVQSLDPHRWSLDEEAQDRAESISGDKWDRLRSLFRSGRRFDRLRPNLDLMLRHASGQLFQEVHNIALKEDVTALNPIARLSGTWHSPWTAAVHFTPATLSRTLVEEALRTFGPNLPATLSVFDPACSTGDFLREMVRQLDVRGYRGRVMLEGWERSGMAADVARFALGWEAINVPFSVDATIRWQDSLSEHTQWPKHVDALLLNPPILSWREADTETRHTIIRVLGAELDKYDAGDMPDLVLPFLHRATDALAPSGVLAAATPASFLDSRAGSRIRKQLSAELEPALIARLGKDLFHQSSPEAALYVASRTSRGRNVPPIAVWTDEQRHSTALALRSLRQIRSHAAREPIGTSQYSVYVDEGLGRTISNWTPCPYDRWKLASGLETVPRVSDVFRVRQTSADINDILVITASEWRALPIAEQRYFRPAASQESIVQARLRVTHAIFFPHGQHELASEDAVRVAVPTYYNARLYRNKDWLLSRKDAPHTWWAYPWRRGQPPSVEPKIISVSLGHPGGFAWDERGEFVVLNGFAWTPKAVSSAAPWHASDWLAWLSILNSDTFHALASAIRSTSGESLTPAELTMPRVPVPMLDTLRNSPIGEELVALGAAMHAGTFHWDAPPVHQRLSALVEEALRFRMP